MYKTDVFISAEEIKEIVVTDLMRRHRLAHMNCHQIA